MNRGVRTSSLWLAAALALAACSGGSPGTAVPHATAKTTPAQLSIVIPLAKQQSSSARRPQFISLGTASGAIALGPSGTNVTQAFDLSASSPNCTTGSTSRTCTVTVDLPIGSDQITLLTYDGPLVSGRPTGHQLATATTTQTIVEGQLNTITISLLGIPASASIAVQQSVITATGSPVTVPLTVTVYDASGNQITGTDKYAQPIALTVSPAKPPGANFSFTVNGSPSSTLTAPTDTVSLTYPGYGGTQSYNVVATTNSGNTALGTAPLTVQPGFAIVQHISQSEFGGDLVQRFDTGDVWLTEPIAPKIAVYSSSGTFVEYPVPSGKSPRHITYTGLPSSGAPLFITELPDTIGRVALNGTITETTVPTPNAGLGGIWWDGANFRLWFAESAGKLGTADLGGTITEYPVGIAGSTPVAVAQNPLAGGIWFTDPGKNAIGWMKPDHSVVEYPIPTANAGPSAIVASDTSNTWFAEDNASKIGHVDNATGAIVEYPAPGPLVALVAALPDGSNASVWGITASAQVVKYDTSGNYIMYPDQLNSGATLATALAQGYPSRLYMLRSHPASNFSSLEVMVY